MIVLSGARIFDGERFRDDHAVVVEGERIAAIVPYSERPRGAVRDLGGGLLAPGYIDVQVNGGGGVLFNEDPTPEGIARIAAAHRNHGTVGLLPTLVTDAPQVMAAAIAAIRQARHLTPATLGIHLEGPFLDPRRKGAHELRYIRDIEPGDVETIADANCGAIILTLAPNRVGTEIIAELARVSPCAVGVAAREDQRQAQPARRRRVAARDPAAAEDHQRHGSLFYLL